MTREMVMCPSMDIRISETVFKNTLLGATSNYGGMQDYGYRYNLSHVSLSYGRLDSCPYARNALSLPGYAQAALFIDSGGCKTDAALVPYPASRSDWYSSDGQAWNAGPNGVVGARYAHSTGGHAMAHDGHAVWLRMILSGQYYGWPNYNGLYSTWSRGVEGIDYWLARK